MNKVVRVLVVDDSAYMRKMIREMLERHPRIEVVGIARDGQDALQQTKELRPDVVLVDLYMPVMDGVEYIRTQMKEHPLPIILCSSASESGPEVIQAMEAGAVEFVHKPTAQALDKVLEMSGELVEHVLAAAAVQLSLLGSDPTPVEEAVEEKRADEHRRQIQQKIDAVVIGVSTGGPRALRYLLPALPADFPVPVAVCLHMPIGYTQPLAEKLNEMSALEVVESSEGLEMRPGRVILAQAGLHTTLERQSSGHIVTHLSPPRSDLLFCPSVDELFKSAAEAYAGRLLGVVLTGMGNDGTSGAAWIKAQGGVVFAEDESTSVVFGMPRSVIEAGLADQIIPLDQVITALIKEVFYEDSIDR